MHTHACSQSLERTEIDAFTEDSHLQEVKAVNSLAEHCVPTVELPKRNLAASAGACELACQSHMQYELAARSSAAYGHACTDDDTSSQLRNVMLNSDDLESASESTPGFRCGTCDTSASAP